MICCTRCDRSSFGGRSACRGMCHHPVLGVCGRRALVAALLQSERTRQREKEREVASLRFYGHDDKQAQHSYLGPRECAGSTNVAAPQLQCGPSATSRQAGTCTPSSPPRRATSEKRQFMVDTCITGAGPRRNAAAQWQRNLSYHHPCAHTAGGGASSSSSARGDRLSARCSSRAATGQAAASETGVCVCVRRALPPRTDTTRAVARAARVH